jgi:16S rRNA (guanine966-N2)-methyltransferase
MRIIAGEWGGRRISAPAGPGVRPTTDRVREAWMSILGPQIPGSRVLDLFAGSGALGLEALSRGAAEVVFVERARGALKALRANIRALDAGERAQIRSGDVFSFLDASEPLVFDLALADPPYDQGLAARLLERFQARPFARELWVEHRTAESLPDLPGLRQRRYGDTTLSHLEALE